MNGHRTSAARACLAALAFALAGCAPLPPLEGNRTASHALQDTASTPLGQAIAPEAARHPGLTGVEPIGDGRVALGMRLALLRAATRSIDIQTFIWRDDHSGILLFEEIVRAAERGVRVRLLLDDVNTAGPRSDSSPLLDAQPNIEVRLYNPFTSRGSRGLGFLGDFARAQPAHAQQVVHGRQPGGDRRRPQHRRRVLRGAATGSASSTSTCSPSAPRCPRSRGSSISTGTALVLSGPPHHRSASRPSAGPSSRTGAGRRTTARRSASTPRR